MSLFVRIIKAVPWALYPFVVLLSVAIALPIVALFWLVWLGTVIFQRFSRPVHPELEAAQVDNVASQLSIVRLLGPAAPRKIDAIFEGGGVKAIAQVGAVRAVEELKLEWSLLGGTSGGAIIASLLAAGKDSRQIWEVLTRTGLHRLVAVWYLPPIPWLQRKIYFVLPLLPHLLFTKGLVSGRQFLQIMDKHLTKDGRQLLFRNTANLDNNKNPVPPYYCLKMVATDISQGTPVVLPDDLPNYWEPWERARQLLNVTRAEEGKLTPKDAQDCWPVAEAVRMSMSIPFFFNPVSLHLNVGADGKTVINKSMGRRGKKVLIVDGGISSNFPIWLFDTLDQTPTWPTFGFLLDETKGPAGQSILSVGNLIDMAVSVINTGMGAMDKRLNEHDKYRTSRLRTLGVNATDFGLAPAKQWALFESGFQDSVEFLKRFDWNEYIRLFRR